MESSTHRGGLLSVTAIYDAESPCFAPPVCHLCPARRHLSIQTYVVRNTRSPIATASASVPVSISDESPWVWAMGM